MNRRNNWFWGLFFLIAAAAMLLNPFLSLFWNISLFQVIFTVLMICLVVRNIPRRNFFGMLIPVALIYMTLRDSLFWYIPISGGSVLGAAVFASLGLTFMFGRRGHDDYHDGYHGASWFHPGPDPDGGFYEKTENMSGNTVSGKVTMGADTKYIHSDCLECGLFSCTMGSLKIYLDQAVLVPGGTVFTIDVTLGEVELYVPREWYVEDQVHAVLGEVSFKRKGEGIPGQSPKLVLQGNVTLAELAIIYV